MGGVFFDALFNLNKFIGFEQRDPFAERQRRNDPFETDWDRCVGQLHTARCEVLVFIRPLTNSGVFPGELNRSVSSR